MSTTNTINLTNLTNLINTINSRIGSRLSTEMSHQRRLESQAQKLREACHPEVEAMSCRKSSLATLVVGQGDRLAELAAHADALNESPFFRIALKKEWPEGQTRKIELPDDDVNTVEDYLHFLYTQQAPEETRLQDLAKLYVFGQKVLDQKYKDAVLVRILYETNDLLKDEFFHDYVAAREAVTTIYEGTPPGSLGRKLMVDIFYAVTPSDWVEDDHLIEFRDDLFFKFMSSDRSRELGNLDISTYQEEVKDD